MTTKVEKPKEDFMTSKWRPMMAMTYMATIWFDFILGPILFNILQYYNPGQAVTSWTPLTLQGGGLYHLAMGTILGISAYTRGKEKVAAIENEKPFSEGFGGTPVASPSAEPQWVSAPPQQGITPQQTWAQPAAPVADPTPAPVVTAPTTPTPAPVDTSPAPVDNSVVSDAPAAAPAVDPTDPDRPLRRVKK